MEIKELSHVIEAILFVAGEPVEVKELQRALEAHEMRLEGVFGELSTDAPNADSDRIFVVARRKRRTA